MDLAPFPEQRALLASIAQPAPTDPAATPSDDPEANALGVGFLVGCFALFWLVGMLALRLRKRLPAKPIGRAGLAFGLLALAAALLAGGADRQGLTAFTAIAAGTCALAYWGIARHRCPQCGLWLEISSRRNRFAPRGWHKQVDEISERCPHCGYSASHLEEIR